MPQRLGAYASSHERSNASPCAFASQNFGICSRTVMLPSFFSLIWCIEI